METWGLAPRGPNGRSHPHYSHLPPPGPRLLSLAALLLTPPSPTPHTCAPTCRVLHVQMCGAGSPVLSLDPSPCPAPAEPPGTLHRPGASVSPGLASAPKFLPSRPAATCCFPPDLRLSCPVPRPGPGHPSPGGQQLPLAPSLPRARNVDPLYRQERSACNPALPGGRSWLPPASTCPRPAAMLIKVAAVPPRSPCRIGLPQGAAGPFASSPAPLGIPGQRGRWS